MTDMTNIAGRYAAGASRLASILACAGFAMALISPAASAQDARSIDTHAIIITPLLEDWSAGPLPSIRLSMDRQETNPVAYGARDASSIVAAGLFARDTHPFQQSFGAFQAPQTVIARTATGSELRVAMYDAEQPDWVRAALAPSGIDLPVWQFSANRPRGRAMALRYEGRFDSQGGKGELDMGLRPRAGVSFGDAGSATEFGATLRVGQYVQAEHQAKGGWWFFAGADRQALIYRPGDTRSVRETLALQPYAMVGDQQAGLAMNVQGVDLSLAYVRRETSWSVPTQSWDTSEDFAAFSLTWRR